MIVQSAGRDGIARTPDQLLCTTVDAVLSDIRALVLAGTHDPTDTDGYGALYVRRAARGMQLYIDAAVQRLTGQPMPTGVLPSPADDGPEAGRPRGWEAAEVRHLEPPLPPVGYAGDRSLTGIELGQLLLGLYGTDTDGQTDIAPADGQTDMSVFTDIGVRAETDTGTDTLPENTDTPQVKGTDIVS